LSPYLGKNDEQYFGIVLKFLRNKKLKNTGNSMLKLAIVPKVAGNGFNSELCKMKGYSKIALALSSQAAVLFLQVFPK